MTEAEIIAAIKADPALMQMAIAGDDREIAKAIAPESRPKSYLLKSSSVLSQFNRSATPHEGGVILKKLRDIGAVNSPLGNNTAEILRLMDGSGWELMDNSAPKILDEWRVAAAMTAAQVTAIRGLAMGGDRPTTEEISKALRPFRPDGKVGQLVGI